MVRAPALIRWSLLSVACSLLACAADPGFHLDASAARNTLQILPQVHSVHYAVAAPAVDRLLLLSGETLWMVHPDGREAESIELPAAVCGLAVHGQRAAVRHEGFLSLIDLPSRTLHRILEIRLPCGDVALSQGYAYLLTPVLNHQRVIQVPLAGGPPEVTEASFYGTDCRLAQHPSANKIYVACNDTVGRIGLRSDGTVDAATSFETQLDAERGCGGMWVTDDGDWAYAACGGQLRSHSDLPGKAGSYVPVSQRGGGGVSDADLSPSGRLPMWGVQSVCETDGVLAVIPARQSPHRVHNGLGWDSPRVLDEHAGRSLEVFSHPQLRPLVSLPVPDFPSGISARGEAVLCGLQDGRVHVLVQGAEAQTWGLWTVTLPL